MTKLLWHDVEEITQRLQNKNVEMHFIVCILHIHSVVYLLRETGNFSFSEAVGSEGAPPSLKTGVVVLCSLRIMGKVVTIEMSSLISTRMMRSPD